MSAGGRKSPKEEAGLPGERHRVGSLAGDSLREDLGIGRVGKTVKRRNEARIDLRIVLGLRLPDGHRRDEFLVEREIGKILRRRHRFQLGVDFEGLVKQGVIEPQIMGRSRETQTEPMDLELEHPAIEPPGRPMRITGLAKPWLSLGGRKRSHFLSIDVPFSVVAVGPVENDDIVFLGVGFGEGAVNRGA